MDASPAPDSRRRALALIITGAAVFMVTLDNLVVTNALPSIRADLGASISQLGWFVNAYTLTFAALLLTGASLGDRFGRRRVFALGLAIFTAGSLGAALATSSGLLIAARSVQGLGAALVMPLSLTLLRPPSRRPPRPRDRHLVGPERPRRGARARRRRRGRRRALVAVDLLPERADRHRARARSPIACSTRATVPTACSTCAVSCSRARACSHSSGASCAATTRAGSRAEIVGALALAVALLGVVRRLGAPRPAPMLPLRLFRSRAFSATNGVSLIMNFGIFGSIFLLAQFLQTVQGYSAFDAGVRTLPWTLMPMFIAPLAGLYSDRIGSRPLMFTGPRAAGDGARLARQRGLADGCLQQPGHPLRARRHRHGTRLRSRLEHDPLEREPQRRGQGQRRQQRHSRSRRHARRRRARQRVQPRGQSTLTGQGFVDGLVPAVWIGAVVLAGGRAARPGSAGPARRAARRPGGRAPAGREPELALDLSAS